MKDNSKILEDISTLTQICHSNSDGPTLKIEENEIKHKITEYEQEIQEIKTIDVEDSYDTSAEMADRNIEIISKKLVTTLMPSTTNTERIGIKPTKQVKVRNFKNQKILT